MRILITGGNGYLGRKIVEEIIKRGHTAVLLILEGTDTSMFSKLQNIEIYSTSEEDIEVACKSNIDCVLHLATLYGRNGESYDKVLNANFLFPLRILDNAIKNDIEGVYDNGKP